MTSIMETSKHCLLVLVLVTTTYASVKEMEIPGLYEGDIELQPEQREQLRAGGLQYASLRDGARLWPKVNGQVVIPYVIDRSLTWYKNAMDELKLSISEYHKYTCIRFVERKNNERHYIEFHNGRGCSSPLGVKCYDGSCNQHNRISLAEGCWWRGTIMHEIGHSIGLHHEQTRPDRDQYVEILKDNVYPSMVFNFDKRNKSEIDSLGTPYDYLSMMHYGWKQFGRAHKMTIKTLDPRYQYVIGQVSGFSQTDVIQINKLYKCSGNYPKIPPREIPPEGCRDLSNSCLYRRHHGYCTNTKWKRFMYKNCYYACGYCGNEPKPTANPTTASKWTTKKPTEPKTTRKETTISGSIAPCRNRVRDCASIGKRRCNDESASWRAYMAKSCRLFCNLC